MSRRPADDIDPDEPVGYLDLPKGTPVVSSDGVRVGTVQKVMYHERERILDGLVVQGEHGRHFVDAPEVGLLTRRQVELEIDAATFAALPPPAGLMNRLDSEARRVGRRLRRKLPGG